MAMRVKLDEDDNIEVQMAPLIDCMFLLLIFFLVATTLKKMSREIPVELPYTEAAIEVPEEPNLLVIGIDKMGGLYLNGTEANRQMVADELHAAAAATTPVRIDADRLVPYENVLEVIELCHIQGVTDVGLHSLDPRSLKK